MKIVRIQCLDAIQQYSVAAVLYYGTVNILN